MDIKRISDTVSLLGNTHNMCHKSFLAAATSGPEELLAWAQCYLVFGNASLLPESGMCHSLEEVVQTLCNCAQSGAAGRPLQNGDGLAALENCRSGSRAPRGERASPCPMSAEDVAQEPQVDRGYCCR